MSLTVSLTPQGTEACAAIFTNSWERGHQTPYQGFAPGPNLRLSDNLTPHQNRGAVPQTVGPEPQGTRAWPHFYKQLGTYVEQRGTNKKLTIQCVLPATNTLAKMINCTSRAISLNNFLYKNKSGTLVDVGQQTSKRKLPIHKCVDLYLRRFPVDICSPKCIICSVTA